MLSILSNAFFQVCKGAVSDATSDITDAAPVDMAEAGETVIFAVHCGTIGGTGAFLTLVQSEDNYSDDYTAIEGSKLDLLASDSDKLVLIECVRPRKRFVRVVVDRTGRTMDVKGIIAVGKPYHRTLPVVQDSTVGSKLSVISPPEGTP